MKTRHGRDIVHRSPQNPLIGIRDLGFMCSNICNVGAVKTASGYVLLMTVQGLEGLFAIYAAHSEDGYNFEIGEQPVLAPLKEGPAAIYERNGLLDPRIVPFDGGWYISYDALGPHGYRLGLAYTTDFQTFDRRGLISEPDTKGGALFAHKIKGKYARLERPWERSNIWVSYSEDLKYWGDAEVIMTPRSGYWDAHRVGVGAPPMAIKQGWLLIYYGVKQTAAGPLFRLGAAIVDREEPTRIIGRTNVPILSPRETYERIGDAPNLVFTCGAIIEPDDEVKIYYGASNSCICMGTTAVSAIVTACLESDREY